MKKNLYLTIALLCTGLSGMLQASNPNGFVVGLLFTNNTKNTITVTLSTNTEHTSSILPGATYQTAPVTIMNTTQITISDSTKSPTINFLVGNYWCANSGGQVQGINSYTITKPKKSLVVTPAACPPNYTLQS